MGDQAAIRSRGLVKVYPPDVRAVDGLDLEVRRGECFGLLGPNGAGKTTTLEIWEGLLDPTAGEVEVLGRTWRRDRADLRARLGITLQQTHLDDRLQVQEILALFRSFFHAGRDVEAVLKLVALEDKRRAWFEHLSGGQKQRLAVGCALVGDPELVFLDEPTTGLDPQSRRQLWDVVADLRAQGRTVVLTTHYMDEAERLCDRVAVVDHGKLLDLGTPRELVSRHAGHDLIDFECAGGAPDLARLLALPGVRSARLVAGVPEVVADRVHETVPALLALLQAENRELLRLATRTATLEDVFVNLTGRHLRD